MSKLDHSLRMKAKKEQYPMPDDIKQSIEELLDGLPEKTVEIRKEKTNRHWKWSYSAALAVIAVLIICPNFSPSIAYAWENVPVIGNFIKVITIRNYLYEDGNSQMHIKIPWIDESEYTQSAQKMNQSIEQMTDEILEKYQSDIEQYGEEAHMYKCVDYETITNSEKWFVLQLTITETASSNTSSIVYYNLDKETGKIVTFDELFSKDSSYKELISQEIQRQMEEQTKADDTKNYWIDSENAEWDFMELGEKTHYYITEDGELVVAFEQGQVGPYSMGTPNFVIPKQIIEKCLKKEFLEVIR